MSDCYGYDDRARRPTPAEAPESPFNENEALLFRLVDASIDCLALQRLLPQALAGEASDRLRGACEALVEQLRGKIQEAADQEAFREPPPLDYDEHVGRTANHVVALVESGKAGLPEILRQPKAGDANQP